MNFGVKIYDTSRTITLCTTSVEKDKAKKVSTDLSTYMKILNNVMFTQMTAKVGIRSWRRSNDGNRKRVQGN